MEHLWFCALFSIQYTVFSSSDSVAFRKVWLRMIYCDRALAFHNVSEATLHHFKWFSLIFEQLLQVPTWVWVGLHWNTLNMRLLHVKSHLCLGRTLFRLYSPLIPPKYSGRSFVVDNCTNEDKTIVEASIWKVKESAEINGGNWHCLAPCMPLANFGKTCGRVRSCHTGSQTDLASSRILMKLFTMFSFIKVLYMLLP